MALGAEDPTDSVFHRVVPCHSAWAVYHQTAWEVVWVGDRHLGDLDDQAEAEVVVACLAVQVVQTDLPPWVEVGVVFGLGDLLHQVGDGEVVGQAVQALEACQAFLEETFLVAGSQVAASYQVEAYLEEACQVEQEALAGQMEAY